MQGEPLREREIGQLIEAGKQQERALASISGEIEDFRKQNEAAHNRTDNRIIDLNAEVVKLQERVRALETRSSAINRWLIAAAAMVVSLGIVIVGWGDHLDAQFSGILVRTANVEQETRITHQEQTDNYTAIRNTVSNMSQTIATISTQLSDLQRCITTKRGC